MFTELSNRTRNGLAIAGILFVSLGTGAGVDALPAKFVFHELADGIFLASPNGPGSNSVVIVGNDEVLVVDAQLAPTGARALIDAIADLTPHPVTTVVVTHWHIDHAGGAGAFRDMFGDDVAILAHPSTAADLDALGPEQAALAHDFWTGFLERQPSADEADARVDAGIVDDLATHHSLPETVLVEDQLQLDIGGRRVEVHHLGAGHTRGDLVVWLPAERIVAVGDLALPTLAGHAGYPFRMLETLRGLAALDFELMVPGHAGVARGGEQLVQQIESLAALLERVRHAHDAGATQLDDLDSDALGSVILQPERFVARAFAEIRGELELPAPATR